jgi:hypothetical protein
MTMIVKTILSAMMFTQVHAVEVNSADADYYNAIAKDCGTNLQCYFTPQEIESALGMPVAEAQEKGLLDESPMQRFADEGFEQNSGHEALEGVPMAAMEESDLLGSEVRRRRRSGRAGRHGVRRSGGVCSHTTRALVGYHQQGSPVWGHFISALKSFRSDCVPQDYNTFRPRSDGFSCHNSNRAVDVGAISCGGRKHYAINGGTFAQLVSSARRKGMHVLYMQGGCDYTQSHKNHGHFSIGCPRPGGGRYW